MSCCTNLELKLLDMKTILVLIDFSKKAERAALMAMEIARVADAQIELYTAFAAPRVYPSEAGIFPAYESYADDEKIVNGKLKALAKKIARKFSGQALPIINYKSGPGNLADNIEVMNPWLIVMGGRSKETALSHFVFGSDCSAVMDKASCPVLVVPVKTAVKPFMKIAFATEYLSSEKDALSFVEYLAALWNASLTVLHVSDPQLPEDIREDSRYDYRAFIAERQYNNLHYADVRGKYIAHALTSYADFKAFDMIAIAHKKRSFFGQLLHTSISKTLLTYQHVPVLILQKP